MAELHNACVVKLATQNEVELFANAAGVTDRIDPVRLISFSENLNDSDLKLIELPQSVISRFEAGEPVLFRGRPDDTLVLCTQDKSYEVQQADTSNLLLLSPNVTCADTANLSETRIEEIVRAEVIGSFHETFELKEFRPKYERIHSLLDKLPFRGIEQEIEPESACTFSDLLSHGQAGGGELLVYLKKIQAFEFGGRWRLLEDSFRDSVVVQILNLIEERGWSWRRFPQQVCSDVLAALFPKFVLEHVLSVYGKQVDGEHVSLDEEMICMFHAECLLRPVRRFSLPEFLEIWQQSVPSGIQTKSSHLSTISIKDISSSPPSIWHFPEERLNSQPYERIVQLFNEKGKWSESEIKPFLKPLETSKLSVNSLLLRYTRSSMGTNGEKYFSLKKTH